MSTRQATAKAGKKLGRYRIERELGRGGMGVVYVAVDENTGRQVALKTTSVAALGGGQTSRTQRRQRFIREVQALAQVSHDNVVTVIDAGEADDPDLGWVLFYSMDYVEGETLADLVHRDGGLDPGVSAAVCAQVASGLGAAHRAGIVHRDVKPANVFISLDGRALIGDFGICKIEGQTQITRREQVVGTPNYLAPEQILGDDVTPATDVFAIGALFYVITLNRPLRSRVDAKALLASAQGDRPKEKLLAEEGLPPGLKRVIARCLERDPAKRWSDGAALAEALADFATKIPRLVEPNTAEVPKIVSLAPADASSPFASLEQPDDGPGMSVEEAARTLLGEVDGRDPLVPRPRRDDEPLLIARTESTTMFNRNALDDNRENTGSLPVARVESTVMFELGEEQARALFEKTPALAEHTVLFDREPRVRHVDVESTSRPIARPAKRRTRWVPIALAAAVAVGLVVTLVVLARAPAPPPRVATVEAVVARPRPSLCPLVPNVIPDLPRSRSLVAEARAAEGRGAQGSAIKAMLEEAIQANPNDADAFYNLGRTFAKGNDLVRAEQAFECVCFADASSARCRDVSRR